MGEAPCAPLFPNSDKRGSPLMCHSALETICDKLLSSFAFKLSLRRFTRVQRAAVVAGLLLALVFAEELVELRYLLKRQVKAGAVLLPCYAEQSDNISHIDMVDNHIDIPYPKSMSHIPHRYSYRYLIDVRSSTSISNIDTGSCLVTLFSSALLRCVSAEGRNKVRNAAPNVPSKTLGGVHASPAEYPVSLLPCKSELPPCVAS